jgi:hypothetical protein
MAEAMVEKPVSLGTFRVIGKHIIRASIVSLQMGTRGDGTPNIVQQAGPSERVEVGTELTDVQEHELKAFGDRFQPVDDAAQKTVVRLSGVEPVQGEESPEHMDATAAMPGGAPSSPQDTPHPPVPGPPAEEPPAETTASRQARSARTPAPESGPSASAGHEPEPTPGSGTARRPAH